MSIIILYSEISFYYVPKRNKKVLDILFQFFILQDLWLSF